MSVFCVFVCADIFLNSVSKIEHTTSPFPTLFAYHRIVTHSISPPSSLSLIQLAMWQAEWVTARLRKLFPKRSITIKGMTTTGDDNLQIPLSQFSAKGVFTKELDIALLSKQVDMVVHCVKDLPTLLPDGISAPAILDRGDTQDAVVMHPKHQGKSLADLPPGAVIGTSALRRTATLARHFPELVCKSIRGNVHTRLRKLDSGDYDAVILAVIGLERLNLQGRIAQTLSEDKYGYAVGQGALAIAVRTGDTEMTHVARQLENLATTWECFAERAMLRTLEGGCKVPIAVRSTLRVARIPASRLTPSKSGEAHRRKSLTTTHHITEDEKLGRVETRRVVHDEHDIDGTHLHTERVAQHTVKQTRDSSSSSSSSSSYSSKTFYTSSSSSSSSSTTERKRKAVAAPVDESGTDSKSSKRAKMDDSNAHAIILHSPDKTGRETSKKCFVSVSLSLRGVVMSTDGQQVIQSLETMTKTAFVPTSLLEERRVIVVDDTNEPFVDESELRVDTNGQTPDTQMSAAAIAQIAESKTEVKSSDTQSSVAADADTAAEHSQSWRDRVICAVMGLDPTKERAESVEHSIGMMAARLGHDVGRKLLRGGASAILAKVRKDAEAAKAANSK
jgi:hydroxymethylbilane synthase